MASKLLLVDDDIVFLKSLKQFFELNNFEVEISAEPGKAIQLFAEQHFDCVLLDLKMPGIDGLSVLQKLHMQKKSVPVIMITGNITASQTAKAARFGAIEFIEKGEQPNYILTVVNNVIARKAGVENPSK